MIPQQKRNREKFKGFNTSNKNSRTPTRIWRQESYKIDKVHIMLTTATEDTREISIRNRRTQNRI